MMKKSILIAAMGLFSLHTTAQDTPKEEGFVFTTVKENPITSIKNQNRAGTCWCYSGLGVHRKSELLRMGKGEYDLVRNVYRTQYLPGPCRQGSTHTRRHFLFSRRLILRRDIRHENFRAGTRRGNASGSNVW